ncbi:hypothetical protein BDY24DRAFT_411743 [Mrakia frigida]|uniref:uncharacterized protein n=1 Tax=Mrakia frigida TaxID=29902 RepID=UPI003FCC2527
MALRPALSRSFSTYPAGGGRNGPVARKKNERSGGGRLSSAVNVDAEVEHEADQLARGEGGEGKLVKMEQEGLELQGMGTADPIDLLRKVRDLPIHFEAVKDGIAYTFSFRQDALYAFLFYLIVNPSSSMAADFQTFSSPSTPPLGLEDLE